MNWANVINETLRYLETNIMTVQGPKRSLWKYMSRQVICKTAFR